MTDLNKVDLNLLRVFHAIAEERSLTRAGQRLGLSQPAISYALGRLRALFDDPLFVRTSDGMLPTSAGQQLVLPVNRAMASIRDALQYRERFDLATTTRVFRLSMSDIGEQVFLPPICEQLQRIAPNVTLEAEQVPLAQVEEAMRHVLESSSTSTTGLPHATENETDDDVEAEFCARSVRVMADVNDHVAGGKPCGS